MAAASPKLIVSAAAHDGTASKAALLINFSASSNTVQGNLIGTDVTGNAALGGNAGVVVAGGASGNLIGGETAAARNVISGNATGVSISNSISGGATANLVQGNFTLVDSQGEIRKASQKLVPVLTLRGGRIP